MSRGMYKRVPLRGEAIQWTGDNLEELAQFCLDHGLTVEDTKRPHHDSTIILRKDISYNNTTSIKGLHRGFWIVVQENGQLKVYSNAIFKKVYEPI
jgi:hypothetical protein